MEIEVTVPSLLSGCTDGRTRFTFRAEQPALNEAMDSLFEAYPLLRRHLCDERDRIRRHVLVFLNEERIPDLRQPGVLLQPGDQLHVLQNVSGG
jgi:molybdopterin synthase sulfur carrier subunit